MKIPKYIKVTPISGKPKSFTYCISIKKWGIPILVFKAIKNFDVPWWAKTIVYIKTCFRMIRSDAI